MRAAYSTKSIDFSSVNCAAGARGLWLTISITAGAAAIGLAGGLIVAMGRMSENPLIRVIATGYVNLFRALPLLVQILIWYNLGTLLPELGIGIPFTDIGFYAPTNDVLSPMAACLVALGLNQSAYMGEIIRGGLLSVQHGQIEAAVALGMTRTKVFWRVVAPQAARSIIPPMGNDVINLLKATSLVSVVGVGDLMTRAQGIYAATYQVIPLLLVASFWYLVLTALLALAQKMPLSAASPPARNQITMTRAEIRKPNRCGCRFQRGRLCDGRACVIAGCARGKAPRSSAFALFRNSMVAQRSSMRSRWMSAVERSAASSGPRVPARALCCTA